MSGVPELFKTLASGSARRKLTLNPVDIVITL